MRHKTISLLFMMLFLLPVIAGAVSEKDFDMLKVGDSIHARYTEAMAISVEKP